MTLPPQPRSETHIKEEATSRLLAEWTRLYRPALASYFRKRMQGRGDVEDLVQEVFLRLARQPELRNVRLVEPYLFQTASHVLTDHARAGAVRQAQSHDSYEEDVHATEAPSPERVMADRQAVDRLLAALAELPEKTRMIFVLRRWEGLANADIARRVGVSVSAIEKHISKALAHLKARMETDSD